MEQAPQEQPLKEEAPQEQLSKQQPHQEQPPKEQPRQDQSDQAQSFQGDVKDKGRLTVLTWNIDGLDPEDILERLKELISTLQKYCPDVILLQELIPPIVPTLLKCLKTYDFLRGKESGYFTGIMLRKSRVQLLQKDIVNYPTTEMGRNLLMAQVKFFDHNLCVMTSHLESCKESSQERLNQLRRVWKRMREADESLTVIFGGDTNLRDWEVKKLGGLPEGISDVWELLGQPEDCRYTWDTTTNNNKDLPFPARLRFDRVFIRAAKEGAQVVPETMVLVGQERLSCGRFTSDHWAILCTFSITEGHDGPPQNSS
ncbi:tyrosyl-DNA phosphodiesterase 2 [Megalops cyprinoides]|uniref:tyrosyl-DNA phosphodiesterase 2 n=1 Tax=Megalops cyprinoides TaxID=118141 RepID=UPI001863FD30|nr:tyrosyl-DNA phosphodiesterase 2 [Megalops cyprinoides]